MACIVRGCRSRPKNKENSGENISFHGFPKNEVLRSKWFAATCRSEEHYKKYWKVCSRHFAPTNFVGGNLLRAYLKENSVPTLNLPHKSDMMGMESSKWQATANNINSTESQDQLTTAVIKDKLKDFSKKATMEAVCDLEQPNCTNACLMGETKEAVAEAVYKGRIDKLEKKVEQLQRLAKQRLLRLNSLRQKTRRLKQKTSNINLKLIEMLEKEKVDREYLMMLECVKKNKLLERLFQKSQGSVSKECPLELKKFAVTLHYLSPKAYSYIREEFDNVLPHPKTISKWYRSLDCNPGFTKESFDAIKERVAQNGGKPLYCALSMDEMAIRKILEWDGRRYFGYATIGCDIDSDDAPYAKEALTFMVTTVNDRWKIPVGYFLLHNITSKQKALLVEQCITLLNECGVKIVSLTYDGAATNKAMCKNLTENQDTNFFECEGQTICFWPDPCHNIKLVRNTLADMRDLIDGEGHKISWSHIERLHILQKEEGLHLGNKLRDDHVNFVKQKMKVKLATQLLSQSVADALKYCKDKEIPGFDDCEGTIKFISTFNKLFDVMNSRNIHAKGLKRAANPGNISEIKHLFVECEAYINSLKLANDQSLLVNSNRATGFKGFLTCMTSLLQIYKLVENNMYLKYICTYKLSQDHIELFFGAVRSMSGFNNNPSARMFRAAYKKLLIHAELKDDANGNCIPLDQIPVLNAAKSYSSMINDTTGTFRLVDSDETPTPFSGINNPKTIDHDYIVFPGLLSEYSKDVVHYVAGFVVRKLKKNLKCENCLQALESIKKADCTKISLLKTKDRGGLVLPSPSVFKICETTEKVVREMEAKVTKKSIGTEKNVAQMVHQVAIALLQTDLLEDLYLHSMDNSIFDDHRNLLIKLVCQTYLKIRIHHTTKQLALSTDKIRKHLTKTIIFKGQ